MASLNKVLLMGNLTRDPELRYAPSGSAVSTFSVAISRNYNTAAGEKKEDVCYVRVVSWGKLAQRCSEYLFKGRPVFVEGRLQSRSWQAQDGTRRNTLEVIAQNVQFLGRSKAAEIHAHEESSQPEEVSPVQEETVEVPHLEDLSLEHKENEEEVPF